MKKHLSILCVLLMLTFFVSCGDSTSSSDAPEVSESSVSESIKEKIEIETLTEKNDFITVPDLYSMDYDEAIKKYKDIFTILSIGHEESELEAGLIVSQDVEAGTKYEAGGNRPRIRVKLSNSKKKNAVDETNQKTNEQVELNKSYVAKGTGNHSTGISIDYNSEWETKEKLNDTETTITYTMKIPNKCEVVCKYVLAPPSLLSVFAYAPNDEWIAQNREGNPYSSVRTNANGHDFLFHMDEFDRKVFQCSNGYTAFTMTITKLCYSWKEFEDIEQAIFDSIDIIDSYEIPEKEEDIKEAIEPQTEKTTEPPKPANVESNEALKLAKSYIDMSGFSYEELISQLEYEGFTHDEAVAAADSCGADWNAEALESAKSYIEISGFSYTSLVSQLEYEKFTHDQAIYGADNCGADWNQQAADSARSYLNAMAMSREELLDQLLYEGFTQEQAEFGLQSVGY